MTAKREQLFDEWSRNYEPQRQDNGKFPFCGYKEVLDEIALVSGIVPGMTVLDLGIGTGNLAQRFQTLGCRIWGLDFSSQMLEKARQVLPEAVLIKAGLEDSWPDSLNRRFDRIVSAYVFHEIADEAKINLLKRLSTDHLSPGGKIVIGDIAFSSTKLRQQANENWQDLWDEDEHYWAADEIIAKCRLIGLEVVYKQISICGGVFIFANNTGDLKESP